MYRLLFSLLLLSSAPNAHAARPLAEAEDALDDALHDVEGANRDCREALRDEIKDAVRDLDRASSPKKLRRVLRDLEDLKRDADECPRSVERSLKRAIRAVEEALEHEGDDRRAKPSRPKVDCWSANDPGCGRTKNGHPPMGTAAYTALYNAVKSQSPHVFPMLDTLKAGLGQQYLTSEQMRTFVELLKPHVHPMLDAVKVCAPRLVDPENGTGIGASFSPHVFPAKEAVQIVSAQRSDPQ